MALQLPSGILKDFKASTVEQLENGINLKAKDSIEFYFSESLAYLLSYEQDEVFVLPWLHRESKSQGQHLAWFLPLEPLSCEYSWMIEADKAALIHLEVNETGLRVTVAASSCSLKQFSARPRANLFGQRYHLDFPHGDKLAQTLAAFYWDTLLPCIVERTLAKDAPDADGYVLDTLTTSMYSGTYPDVGHEFHIKGRILLGNELDLGLCRRMLELQLRLMREDPAGLWRDPCAVQLDGTREYHVRRSSLDGKENAEMFLLTGNIAIVESVWLYLAVTKDKSWLEQHINDLEAALTLVEDMIDRQGRLWSDVYYEDQVMKDGRVTAAQAFAANAFKLMAELEQYLERNEKANDYQTLSRNLSQTLVKPLPEGFWDADKKRFIDWVDRHGEAHDHIHLLANILPDLFAYSSEGQTKAVTKLMQTYQKDFQRFPSFVAVNIADYTDSEMGVAGPYDLCATGRYWCWDAAYLAMQGNRSLVLSQLQRIAKQAYKEGFTLAERYDVDYVYYVDGQDWHGAAHYYEYPCVYHWVLLQNYLGIYPTLTADLMLKPMLKDYGKVRLEQAGIALAYEYQATHFIVTNLASYARSIILDLSSLYPDVKLSLAGEVFQHRDKVWLEANKWIRLELSELRD